MDALIEGLATGGSVGLKPVVRNLSRIAVMAGDRAQHLEGPPLRKVPGLHARTGTMCHV
jgi:hypothetical protein